MTTPLPVRIWRGSQPHFLSALRIVAAFVFIQYGTAKLFGWPIMMGKTTVPLMSQMGLAGSLETFGGGLLLLGLFTRPLAFLLCGEMAVAYFQSHAPRGFWPLANQGVPPVLFCFIWLYISAAGPGPWSLDALLRRTEAP
ncbi:MAG TPA: DoxX family protein [Gemmatimonadaceae bacterium]|jgi:putative oxidoreductase